MLYFFYILRLKCTKFDFCSAQPQTPLGELTAPLDSVAVFKGPTFKGMDMKGNGREA